MRTWVKGFIPFALVLGVVVVLAAAAAAQDAPPDGAPANAPADPAPDQPDQPEQEGEAGAIDPQIVAAGQTVLAERFAEMAQRGLRGERIGQAEFRQSAALLRAATTLNPAEPRFWRLLTEAELQLGNGEGALSALQGYRKIAPDDRVAQVQLIELHASRMESGDKAVEYLRNLLPKASVPAEVRSHVAVLLVHRLLDRGEEAQIPAVLDEALTLNPVNVAALGLKYERVASRGTPAERVAGLLALLRGNPVRPTAMAELARLLAAAGLGKESLEWFGRAADQFSASGAADPFTYHDLFVDYASQVYLAGQVQAARGMADQLLKADPDDVDAWLLRLVIDRGAGNAETYAKTRQDAAARLNARWAAAAREIDAVGTEREGDAVDQGAAAAPEPARDDQTPADAGDAEAPRTPAAANSKEAAADGAAAAEPPSAAEAPDPSAVAERVKGLGDDDGARELFVSAVSDLAWFEVYFNGDAAAAGKWIEALATVLPDDNLTLARLRGWAQVAQKQPDAARESLEPVRESDPLSALGLIRLALDQAGGDPDALKAADDQARTLLGSNASGLVGAIVAQALKDRGLTPQPRPDAAALRQASQQFPRPWLDIVDHPERFYSVRAEPLRVAHHYGEPMLVRVVVQNLTDYDITIGEAGVIRPGLWFDAQVQTMKARQLPGVAFERLAQSTVLPARQGLAQYVRFDQGGLADYLAASPTQPLQLTGWCMTNPVRKGEGFGPGPGGFRVPFTRKLSRSGFPAVRPGALEQLARSLEVGLPEAKIRGLDLMGALMAVAEKASAPPAQPQPAQPAAEKSDPGVPPATALAGTLVPRLVAAAADPVPAVAQWAKFELARAGQPEQQAEAVESLLADPRWEGRLLGLVAATELGAAKAEDLAAKVADADGEEPPVRDYAAALVELLQRPPTTTQPAASEGGSEPGADAPTSAPAVDGPTDDATPDGQE